MLLARLASPPDTSADKVIQGKVIQGKVIQQARHKVTNLHLSLKVAFMSASNPLKGERFSS